MSSTNSNNGGNAMSSPGAFNATFLYTGFQISPSDGRLLGFNQLTAQWEAMGPAPLGSEAIKGLASCYPTSELINLHKGDPIMNVLLSRAVQGDTDALSYVQPLFQATTQLMGIATTGTTVNSSNDQRKRPALAQPPQQPPAPSFVIPSSPPPQVPPQASLPAATSTAATSTTTANHGAPAPAPAATVTSTVSRNSR